VRCLAIIPARGGSKRVPRKNIRPFAGRPIIEYSIAAALQSRLFDDVMVSTDDPEIAQIAKGCAATVPFLRSPESSDDHAGLEDVIEEVLKAYAARGIDFGQVCCILPTAPFVTAEMLREGWQLHESTQAPAVVPVIRFSYPILRALRIDPQGMLAMMWPEHEDTRSQDLEPAFHDAGLFYWLDVPTFLRSKRMFPPGTRAVELPESRVQDIDTEEDWRNAEIRFRILRESGGAS